jgi:hypothetical protein
MLMLGLEGLEVMAGLKVMVLIFMSGGPPEPPAVIVGCVGFVGCVAPSDGDFEVLVYQGCLLVSVDECVCDGVGDNDDVFG